eukprot:5554183-Amphidinium_carterae.1
MIAIQASEYCRDCSVWKPHREASTTLLGCSQDAKKAIRHRRQYCCMSCATLACVALSKCKSSCNSMMRVAQIQLAKLQLKPFYAVSDNHPNVCEGQSYTYGIAWAKHFSYEHALVHYFTAFGNTRKAQQGYEDQVTSLHSSIRAFIFL